jgi:tetratricopeptide (TPR) repeat protein
LVDRCHNSYQLALGLIRLGQCREAEEIIESISQGVSKDLSKDFRAAVLSYKALALNTRGQSAEALRILRRAIPLCRGSPIEGNVRGNLASVKIKLAGLGRCRPHRSRKGIEQRLRALRFSLPLLSAYLDLGQAIRITRQNKDQRSAIFWEAARAHFLGALGWHTRAALELERILAALPAKERDAHCLLFINRYAGEVYSVKA